MEAFIEALPNLGVGVASIGAVMYVTYSFLHSMKEERKEHRRETEEREKSFRELEREVRTSIMSQLLSATSALTENSKAMERVIKHLDK